MAGVWWVERGQEARDHLEVAAIVWEKGVSWPESRAARRARPGEAASGASSGADQSLVQGCGGPSHDPGSGQCWGV